MLRYIDADVLRGRMYHDAFETDSDMQKWDSGCWIRYKMFEKALEEAPTVDAEPVVRCKDCRSNEREEPGMVWCRDVVGSWMPENGFCSYGKRRKEE